MKNTTKAIGNLDIVPDICLATNSPVTAIADYIRHQIASTKSKIEKYGTTSVYIEQESRWKHELVIYEHMQEVVAKILALHAQSPNCP